MQYKVPQNVDIEDKVIGGLTLRQFTFLMVAGAFIFILYTAFKDSFFSFILFPIAIIAGGLGLALAFVKVNDRPFEFFIIAATRGLFVPRKRVWIKEDEQVAEATETPKTIARVESKENVSKARTNLQRLATLVDTGYQEANDSKARTSVNRETDKVHDLLERTEKSSANLDKIIMSSKPAAPVSSELPVSALATVKPSDSKFKYEDISLKSETELEEMLQKTKDKQKAQEDKLKNLKIEKF